MPTPPALRHPPPVILPGLRRAGATRARRRRNLTVVLGALPQETELVVWALRGKRRGRLGPFPYVRGRIDGRDTVVAVTGIGKTNAAMVTALFLAHFRPRELLMCGTASRIKPSVRNGDVIVGTVVANHDMGSLAATGAMEYFASEGPLGDHSPILYPADARLLRLARRAMTGYRPERAVQHQPPYAPRVRLGRITSGDQFGIPPGRMLDIRRKLRPDLMEMESGSTAEVCYYLGTPFLCIRSGSNRSQPSPDNDYRQLSPFAARQAALFAVAVVRQLARE